MSSLLYFLFSGDRPGQAAQTASRAPERARSYEAQTASRYLPLPKNPFQAPLVREVTLPPFADANSVWGATGRDDNGGIWVGVSAARNSMSAHLIQYDAKLDAGQNRGSVLDQLRAASLYRLGHGQIKIHTKIIPANDGQLYFASMDEEGENAKLNLAPRWGAHIWRIDPRNHRWQHLRATPEGLIAAAGVGRYVYFLGFWDHVLYQYDTERSFTKRVRVGSAGGHVSRNFVADARGHAFVPRINAPAGDKAAAALVEYDTNLQEVASTPLNDYFGSESPANNHGITGLAYLDDGRIVFTTHRGQLFTITPAANRPSVVAAVGWFHPSGEAYAPSLFSFTGKSLLAGITRRGPRYEWVVHDLDTRFASAFLLDTLGLQDVLLYGSITRDDNGRFYAGGWARGANDKLRPLLLQITPAP